MTSPNFSTPEDLLRLLDAPLEELIAAVESIPMEERGRLISRLSSEARERFMMKLPKEKAAELLEGLSSQQAEQLLSCIPPEQAAQIADEIHSNVRADIVGRMDARSMDAIMKLMEPTQAEELRELISYGKDTAGGLMITEYLVYRDTQKVEEILSDLQANGPKYGDYDIQYAYITDSAKVLVGVLPMRDMIFSARNRPAREVMIKNPVSVNATDSLEILRQFFSEFRYFGVPVVDESKRLCGVLRRAAVEEAESERANTMFMRFSGIIGGEELRSMSLTTRFSRRLSFLSLNILLNIVAASVVAFNMETLEAVIALAVFMPIISDMSGCSGNQAVAVTIRELSLGLARPKDLWYVFMKELNVGVINGVALGLLIALVAVLWKGNIWLGLVVGGALAINTLVAVCFGGLIPLLLKGLKLDPALVSGPLLTTITDMCGFFFVLWFASQVLEKLAGV
jgi:magnesium transporter